MPGRMSAREAIEHLPPTMRDRLATELPAGTELLRSLRYMPAKDFDGLTVDDLDNAVRWLYAAAYSATEAARLLTALANTRRTEETSCPQTTSPPEPSTDGPASPASTKPTPGSASSTSPTAD